LAWKLAVGGNENGVHKCLQRFFAVANSLWVGLRPHWSSRWCCCRLPCSSARRLRWLARSTFPVTMFQSVCGGAVSATGPSIAAFIIMVGRCTVVGSGHLAQLSIIGGAPGLVGGGANSARRHAIAKTWRGWLRFYRPGQLRGWTMNTFCLGWVVFVALFAGDWSHPRQG